MARDTHISWADGTWPVTVGCDKVSAGCYDCYAMRDARRMGKNPNSKISAVYNGLVVQQGNGLLNWTGTVRELPERLDWPAQWREHRDVFVCSQSDLFHEGISDEFIGRVFRVMRENAQHTYYVLTKRPERLLQLLSRSTPIEGLHDFNSTNFPNVIVGISAEDQKAADERMPLLVQVPLDPTQLFVSGEPLIGSLDLSRWIREIGWVIAGGESGRHAKPMHPAWPRLLRDQCDEAEVDFHFKQWGEWTSFPPSVETETVPLDGGSMLYRAKTRTSKTKVPPTTTLDGMTFSRFGRKRTGRVLDGLYWNARPGRDNSTPLYAVHPLGTPVIINESAGPDYNGTQGLITTIQSDDQQPLEELDGEEVSYYLSINGRELAQAFGYWQLSPVEASHE